MAFDNNPSTLRTGSRDRQSVVQGKSVSHGARHILSPKHLQPVRLPVQRKTLDLKGQAKQQHGLQVQGRDSHQGDRW